MGSPCGAVSWKYAETMENDEDDSNSMTLPLSIITRKDEEERKREWMKSPFAYLEIPLLHSTLRDEL